MAQQDVSRQVSRSRFYRIGQFSYRRRFWVLGVWLLILFMAFVPLKKLTERLSQGGFEVPGSQSAFVADLKKSDFKGQFEFSDLLVLRARSLTATDPAYQSVVKRVRAAMQR